MVLDDPTRRKQNDFWKLLFLLLLCFYCFLGMLHITISFKKINLSDFFSTDYVRIFNSSTRRTKYIKYCLIYCSAIFAEELHDRPSSIGGRMQKLCCIWRFVRLIIDKIIIVVNSAFVRYVATVLYFLITSVQFR